MNRISMLFLCLMFVFGACSPAQPGAAGLNATEPPATGEAIIPDTGASATPGIVHTIIPGELPGERVNHAGDQDSSVLADKKRAPSGDRFTFAKFERPFNANTMDVYYANIDLQDITIFVDETFVYGSILVKSMDASLKTGNYGMEFDLDLDGHGDMLVLVQQPNSTDWSTEGVQVWFDANGDVGGEKIIKADEQTFSGDGYETMIFDQGQGNDPDAAWARISPQDPNTIHMAVKLGLFEGDTKFLVGLWAGHENLNPAMFDLNDYFTHEQAGAALPEFEIFYPIKALAELDNSCRLNVGFVPNGSEPGLCTIPGVTPVEEEQAGASCTLTCSGCMILDPSTCSCVPDPAC